jgi:preprotein translocase subunit SecG
MQFYLLILHLFSVAVLIALVLIQQGKGADMGAAFGSGSAGSLFGASGSSNFLSKTTAIFALIFFLTSLSLTYLAFQEYSNNEILIENSDNTPSDPESKIDE